MRRRARKFSWLPTLWTEWEAGDEDTRSSSLFLELGRISNTRGVHQALVTSAIVPDFTQFTGNGGLDTSLKDIMEGQEWFLRRIVGKCFVSCWNVDPNDANAWPFAKVTAGFFVARATDDTQAVVDLETVELDPSLSDNVMNPWIWRNQWLLRNPACSDKQSLGTGGGTGVALGPTNNWVAYGASAKDGPHLDIKTARRITREHRLWFVAVAEGWSGGNETVRTTTTGAQPHITVELDVRCLGAMRKAMNKTAF